MNSNFCGTNVSRLMLSKLSPASLSCGNFLAKVMPFVVIASVSSPSSLPSSSKIKTKMAIVEIVGTVNQA